MPSPTRRQRRTGKFGWRQIEGVEWKKGSISRNRQRSGFRYHRGKNTKQLLEETWQDSISLWAYKSNNQSAFKVVMRLRCSFAHHYINEGTSVEDDYNLVILWDRAVGTVDALRRFIKCIKMFSSCHKVNFGLNKIGNDTGIFNDNDWNYSK